MIKRIGIVALGLGWAFLVFLCTGYFSFPGDAIANRVEVEVSKGSRGAYTLELGDVSPWWVGLSTGSLKVFGKPDKEGVNPLLALATDARASASPLSLLSRTPYVSGSVTMGTEGVLYYEVGTAMDDAGENLQMSEVHLDGQSFPLAEILALVPSMEGGANGKVDLKVDLTAPKGMGEADGEIVLRGKSLVLTNPVIMDFPLGRDVEIRDLDLEFDAKNGKAKVRRGRIVSDIANLDLTGTISLAEPFDRSTVDLRIEAELDPSMSMMAQMFKSAEVNGKLVWRCVGRVAALSRACKPGDRATRAASRPRPTRPGGTAGVRPPRDAPSALSPEEREKRRAELQERLKKRREKRRANRAKRPPKAPPEELEEPEDAALDDDELPLDDEEEPLDDEEIFEEDFLEDE